ncbi:MAG: diphthamide biosynthesis enzyme Dph2 [Candidatus Heimdallarchaeota archaeon]
MYDLDLQKLKDRLTHGNYSRIAIQLPDGLLGKPLQSIIETIQAADRNIEIFVLGDPCFGACDVGVQLALAASCQALFHFGHSPFPQKLRLTSDSRLSIFYFKARATIPIEPILDMAAQEAHKRNFTSIGLATTIQHLHNLPEIEAFFAKAGFDVHTGKATKRLQRGQILGCDIGLFGGSLMEKIQGTVFLGGGRFHALAILRKTKKPVLVADPYLRRVEILDANDLQKFYRKRYAAVNKIIEAEKVGILVSTKTGQYNEKLVQQAQKWLEDHGKSFLIVLVSTVLPQHLTNFHVDGWISTLCPRVALDDAEQYFSPIINLDELHWDNYVS